MDRCCSWWPGNRVLLRIINVSLLTSCQWIETTSLSTAIREGALYYPMFGAFHLLALAWFGGMVLMSDLRILGIGLRHESVSEILSQFRRWKWGWIRDRARQRWAAVVGRTRGVLQERQLSHQEALLLLVGLNALVFRNKIYEASAVGEGGPVASGRVRVAARLSMLLWVALIFSGRGIAFF